MKNFGTGIRHLSAEESKDVDLGPLAQLPGIWVSPVIESKLIAPGWNVISVPGVPNGFVYEVIPYTETLTFSPVVISAGNRGPVVNGQQVEQMITGLSYEQKIISACPPGANCNKRGFPAGNEIHAETGFFLNVGDPNGGYTLARLSTIPHGNSLLALGHSHDSVTPGSDFFPVASPTPTNLDGSPFVQLGYTDQINKLNFFQFPGVFDQTNPNSFLQNGLTGKTISKMTTLKMSTANKDAGGGILNLPFISSNINATLMDAIFWIETIEGQTAPQLQYTQTINLVFPPTGDSKPVVWPHITVSTLVKREV